MWLVVYNVLLVWRVEMQCDEWVMHGMMRWDQCDEWVMHSMMQCVMNGWCMSGVLCYGNELMNEWMNERMNEWINERVGNVEWLCILLYFICICNMFLYLFRAIFYWRIKPIYTPGQVLVILHTEPDLQHIYIYLYFTSFLNMNWTCYSLMLFRQSDIAT